MTDRDRLEVGLRRVPELDPTPLPESDPELAARIAAEIRETGPMPFARFMELALYDPERGYYTAAGRGPGGEGGDFLTAPESNPIFGWAIARHIESVWEAVDRPARFVIREHGAGTGALAAAILDGLRRSGSALLEAVRYEATDAAPARLASLEARLARDGLAGFLEAFDPTAGDGLVLANELLDALPVHRVVGTSDGIEEQLVALDSRGSLTFVTGPPSTARLAARLEAEGVALQPGQVAEVCLAVDDWLEAAVLPLARGELLVIDYGRPAAELYAAARGSTLRAYSHHRVHADPLVSIGRQDLTAHVDLTAVERAAVAAGLEPLARTTQATFLADLGLGELLVALQSGEGATLERYLAARAAVARLVDPRATGGFAVLAFGRGLTPDSPPAGLRHGTGRGLFRRAER